MYHVATLMDSGQRADKEAAMVKWLASEMAERVTSDALQILGGAGYTKLHAVERHWRDAPPHQDLRRHQRNPTAHHLRPPAGQAFKPKLGLSDGNHRKQLNRVGGPSGWLRR